MKRFKGSIMFFFVIAAFIIVGCYPYQTTEPGREAPGFLPYGDMIDDYEMEIPNRFVDNGNGTVYDHATELTWLKTPSLIPRMSWDKAVKACESLKDDGTSLTDGSSPGDWRLPTLNELQSLLSTSKRTRRMLQDHPFVNIKNDYYWSSTKDDYYDDSAWLVRMPTGTLFYYHVDRYGDYIYFDQYYVWPVKGTRGY
ncbi:MAG: DUF1566 domain-containing protein [Deltaproteobacteria bacterium]|nr:DUF1566 domain-containing protein [Deltaproteobacteria bacterium]MBW1914803.1 DUF1566 domain-containing protein [Deltaproteobacteria bacterium]